MLKKPKPYFILLKRTEYVSKGKNQLNFSNKETLMSWPDEKLALNELKGVKYSIFNFYCLNHHQTLPPQNNIYHFFVNILKSTVKKLLKNFLPSKYCCAFISPG